VEEGEVGHVATQITTSATNEEDPGSEAGPAGAEHQAGGSGSGIQWVGLLKYMTPPRCQ